RGGATAVGLPLGRARAALARAGALLSAGHHRDDAPPITAPRRSARLPRIRLSFEARHRAAPLSTGSSTRVAAGRAARRRRLAYGGGQDLSGADGYRDDRALDARHRADP